MRDEAQRWVLCYDVPDDKRRVKLARLLDGYGDRVQFSVFEAKLSGPAFEKMMEEVGRLIDPKADAFSLYRLCSTCQPKALRLGVAGEREPPGEEKVFVV